MFESWPELWGGGYPAYRTTLRKFLWFRTVTGGNAPEYDTVIGRIVSFLTQRAAPLKIEADLSPIQDLHGYDAPWPPGGGKNKVDASAITSENYYIRADHGGLGTPSTAGVEWRYTPYISVTPGEVLYFGEINATASSAGTAFYSGNNEENYISGFSATELANAGNVWTVPSGVAYMRHSFRIDAGYNANWQTSVYIVKNSDPHEWTPYSNECPISGHTGAEVVRTGKNIWGGLPMAQSFDGANGYALDTNAKTFQYKRSTSTTVKHLFDGKFKENSRYTLIISATATGANTSVLFHYTDGTEEIARTISATDTKTTFVGTSSANKTLEYVGLGWKQTGTVTCYYEESGLFEGVLTADQFEPYSGTTVTISFGTTVYGGPLTGNEDGTGSVVSNFKIMDLGDANWSYDSHVSDVKVAFITDRKTGKQNVVCSAYKTKNVAIASMSNGEISTTASFTGLNVMIKDSRFVGLDATQVKQLLSGVQLVYELATPITIPLTPGIVEALKGNNTVWVDDSDEIKVTYRSN